MKRIILLFVTLALLLCCQILNAGEKDQFEYDQYLRDLRDYESVYINMTRNTVG